MKYIILVPDGMADEPVEALGMKTPLEAAQTPNMDLMAQNGFSAMVQTIPDGLPPGSDVGNLSLLGYDPTKNFSGRAPLEAANMGVILKDDEVAFRCNFVTINQSKMVDYSAGHITTEEAAPLVEALNDHIGSPDIKFYLGKSYRHLMVVRSKNIKSFLETKCTPPHDFPGQEVRSYLPQGAEREYLLALMEKAKKILVTQNSLRARRNADDHPANSIWLWGQGKRPHLPLFSDKFGMNGAIISAVDLVNGIGRLVGLEIISVPGATGYYDTDYRGKAEYALNALKRHDFVYIHVESPDEAGHNGDHVEKVKAIEQIDKEIVGRILEYCAKNADVRILIAPDHPTPVGKKTHTRNPVCFVMYGKNIEKNQCSGYSEKIATQVGLKYKSGAQMVADLLERTSDIKN